MKIIYLTLLVVSISLTSCMTQTITLKKGKGDVAGRVPDGGLWAHYLVFGLIPVGNEINAAQVCKGQKIERVEDTEDALSDQPWNLFVGWIWYSRSISVYCSN